jgi:hypothetical protein
LFNTSRHAFQNQIFFSSNYQNKFNDYQFHTFYWQTHQLKPNGFRFQTFFSQIVKQQLENSATGTMPRTPATARRVQLAQCPSNANVASPMTSSVSKDPTMPSPEQSAVMKLLKSGNVDQVNPLFRCSDQLKIIISTF